MFSFKSWIRSQFNRATAQSINSRGQRRPLNCRPRAEQLEDRLAPAQLYWSQTTNWNAPGTGGAVYTSDDGGATVTQIASGFNRIDDVEVDSLNGKIYWNNWASGQPNNTTEGIYRADLNGSNVFKLVSKAQSNSTSVAASGEHGIALDPASGVVYFTRGVSYADNNGGPEVSKINMDGTGYTRLSTNNSGWFFSGIDVDPAAGTLYWGSPGVLNTGTGGAVNRMTTNGTGHTYNLVAHTDGHGRAIALDAGRGLLFYTSWGINAPASQGGIYVYNLSTGTSTQVLNDTTTGIPDVELDTDSGRIYWTEFVHGRIRSATYNASGTLSGITNEVTGLTNPYGLALQFNDAPSNVSLTGGSVNENGTFNLSGTFTDPNVGDTHTVTVTWGPGEGSTTVTLPVGQRTFSIPHKYLDDKPSATTSDVYPIEVVVSDMGVTAVSSATVTSLTGDVTNSDFNNATSSTFGPVLADHLTFSTTGYAHSHSVPVSVAVDVHNPNTNAWTTVFTHAISSGGQFNFNGLTVNFAAQAVDQVRLTSNPGQGQTYHSWGNLSLLVAGSPATTNVTVHNVAPSNLALNLSAATIGENGSTTLSGTFADPGTLDTHTVTINWGDGSPNTVLSLAAGVTAIPATSHQYKDDNPTGTPSDVYTINVTVTDDDTGSTSGSAALTVNNVAPALSNLLVTSAVNENGVATLTGTITDPGTQDAFTLTVNWGEGAPQAYMLAAGTTSFSVSHQYLDDNPTGTASDVYTIGVSLTDDDGGSASSTRTVAAWTGPGATPQLNPSSSTFVESGVAVEAFWATSIGSPSGSFTGGHFHGAGTESQHFNGSDQLQGFFLESADGTPFDLVSLDYRVSSTGSINGYSPSNVQILLSPTFNPTQSVAAQFTGVGVGGSVMSSFVTLPVTGFTNLTRVFIASSASVVFDNIVTTAGPAPLPLTVSNVAPSNLALNLSAATIGENGSTTLSGTFADPGTLDTHTVTINWGDGSPNTVLSLAAGVTAIPATSHQYKDDNPTGTPSDVYTINVTVTDDDTGSTSGSAALTVDNLNPTLSGLSATAIFENGTTALSGTIADVGTQDTFTVEIDWDGDGSYDETHLNVGAGTFSYPHQYLDDNPTGTTVDNIPINVRVTDDDTGSVAGSTTTTVTNLAPVILTVSATSANEDGVVTLTGTYSDVGTQDTHTLTINWGEGAPQTFAVSGGSFSFTHQYLDDNPTGTPSDVYAIGVVLTDDDTGSVAGSTTTTVTNLAPVILTVSATSANEDGVVTLTGTYSDVGTQDTHTLTINWGEGAPQTFAVSGGSFSFTHQYLDDNPTGTPSDVYAIGVVLTDDDTGSVAGSTTTTVTNLAPVILTVSATSANEDGVVTLTGTYSDVGTQDTHTLTINWGEGAPQTFAVSGGSFSFTHQYLDDNPTGTPSDVYAIGVVLTDDDTGSVAGSTTTTVTNLAPVILTVSATSANEDGVVTLTGTYSDVGTQDTHTLTINWGEGAPQTFAVSGGSFSFTHQYLDDNPTGTPSDVYAIGVVLTDDDTGSVAGSTTTTVTNLAPVITGLSNNSPDCGDVMEGQALTLTIPFTDVGTQDTHKAVVNWGDGQTSTLFAAGTGSGTINGTHVYAAGGVYAITVTLSDDDTGTVVGTTQAVIGGVGVVNGTLYVIGTDAANHVSVNKQGNGQIKVHADFLPNGAPFKTFDLSSVQRVMAFLCGGDDHMSVAGNIDLPVLIDGGSGDDHLIGGGRRSILVGGLGSDKLTGGSGDDLLIGGTVGFGLNVGQWGGVLDEWASNRSYAARVANLKGTGSGPRANGNNFLKSNGPGATVFDDAAADQMNGSSGQDWYFAMLTGPNKDKINGNTNGEFVEPL